jgi:ribosomal protein S18 acetylase RimI-like enzyme
MGERRHHRDVEIRRVERHEWPSLREIRLRALADAPDAFATTHEYARAQPDSYWLEMVEDPAWVAVDDGHWVGMVRARRDGADAQLLSMWVDPVARKSGLGRALVDEVVVWARDEGLTGVELWVAEPNDAAVALYRSTGFIPTGRRQPLPSNPRLTEHAMRLELPPPTVSSHS